MVSDKKNENLNDLTFNSDYTEYWQKAVDKSVDGTIIAGQKEVKNYFEMLKIQKVHRVLDAGCSYGRMFSLLENYGLYVDGFDPDPYALEKARKHPYSKLLQGSCESTGLPNNSYDFVFSWAVFDVVNQTKSLQEMNRILKIGGQLLFTGKNDNYKDDDELAFIAERNAFLKSFPNQFTNLPKLLGQLGTLGFKFINILIFENRGDVGKMNYRQIQESEATGLQAYEYLLLLEKCTDIEVLENLHPVASRISLTASRRSSRAGFIEVEAYFRSIS